MISIRHTITGNLATMAAEIERAASQVVEAHAKDLHAAILQSFEGDKSGRLYTRNDGSVYQASAPGEAPAIKEGELFASVQVERLSALAWLVFSDDPKAPWLEYGTDRIEPRPAFGPAADQQRAAFLADLAALEARLARR